MDDGTTIDVPAVGDEVSRRGLFTGLAAAAGAGLVLGGAPQALAAVPRLPVDKVPRPEVLGNKIAGLTYVPYDALAFFTAATDGTGSRYSDSTSGTGILTGSGYLSVNLDFVPGTVIRQINVAYQGTPVVEIFRRPLNNPNPPDQFVSTSLAAGGGPKTQTLDLTATTGLLQPVTIDADATYTLRFFVGAGSSIYGATLGIERPVQAFQPFSGATPRIYDSREGGVGKLAAGAERTIALGNPGARGAIFNLAVTETEVAPGGTGGFVAAFRADIAWPGNASINWAGTNQNLNNTVVAALDAAGQIKIRGGGSPTHVVIDRVGWLI